MRTAASSCLSGMDGMIGRALLRRYLDYIYWVSEKNEQKSSLSWVELVFKRLTSLSFGGTPCVYLLNLSFLRRISCLFIL